MHSSARVQLIRHGPGARGLRLGLGPGLRPARALKQLQQLLNDHSFWAQGRSLRALGQMLRGSAAAVSLWQGGQLVGFCRASSDGLFRAVVWDVVVAPELQGQGLGRQLVEALLAQPLLRRVERVYLMTSNSAGFYRQLGFEAVGSQQLMLRINMPSGP
ncbi:MAG: GNAT family N-acetyltransferase [Cyanobacteria bacterium M_surface_9_m1_291]|nr:GNAT family N-acetyltransferase [Cyanobacteria bacterium M_surface_9_m1_291]